MAKKTENQAQGDDGQETVEREERMPFEAPAPSAGQPATPSPDEINPKANEPAGKPIVEPGQPDAEAMNVDVEMAPNTYAVVKNLDAFVGVVQQAMSDGWNTTTDVPALVAAAVTNLTPVIAKVPAIAQEWSASKRGVVNSLYLGLNERIFSFIK